MLVAPIDYEESVMLCTPTIEQLVSRGYAYDYECQCRKMDLKNKIVQNRKRREDDDLKQSLCHEE